eukprot:TRINITY_DN7185_c0_g1_i1.p1 TRINITY_DN7185_c0_g1~~TRINITY_DN7185_c0_g1_i1.p1  ORF type:complete len:214 (+),score=67.92 TRINITY_DN7185_c0_g1_i1:43-684(+)
MQDSIFKPKAVLTRDLDGCPFSVVVLRAGEQEADVLYLDDGNVEQGVPLEELTAGVNDSGAWTEGLQKQWEDALATLTNASPCVESADTASGDGSILEEEPSYEEDFEEDAKDADGSECAEASDEEVLEQREACESEDDSSGLEEQSREAESDIKEACESEDASVGLEERPREADISKMKDGATARLRAREALFAELPERFLLFCHIGAHGMR